MKTHEPLAPDPSRWFAVGAYALAMAWLEAAAVLYLRTLTDRIDPYQADPLPLMETFARAEMIREFATMVMLAAVGWLAGRSFRTRAGYFLIAFGVWDIFYYVFLRLINGWPRSFFDWDVLFLLPLPWWGPVVTPVSIALLMIAWGTLVTQGEPPDCRFRFNWLSYGVNAVGILLALYVFMADAIRLAPQGSEALRQMLPGRFNWPLFSLAWLLMAIPVFDLARQMLMPRLRVCTGREPS